MSITKLRTEPISEILIRNEDLVSPSYQPHNNGLIPQPFPAGRPGSIRGAGGVKPRRHRRGDSVALL